MSATYPPTTRIPHLRRANNEPYVVVGVWPVAWRYVVDTVLKVELEAWKGERRNGIEGGTEWYVGEMEFFIGVVDAVRKDVMAVWGGVEPDVPAVLV
ncbi:hypothetical protein HK104_005605 [Borealophlyctis nickersoniae]|nr:hypothetical protein HK104_005605 [Borealophlyctis nickersoniae]